MKWKRVLAVAGLILALGATDRGLRAQEQPQDPPQEPSGEAAAQPVESGEQKTPFWGSKFALYLEAGLGSGSVESLNSSIETSSAARSQNAFDLEDMKSGYVALGWKLPIDRGSFRVVFTGFSEDSYRFTGIGSKRALKGTAVLPGTNLPWWQVTAQDGVITSTLVPPSFVDANGNRQVDDGEIRYFPATPDRVLVGSVPSNALNRVQTWDLLFLRDFGGRTVSARYTCGLRHLVYEGNVPAAAWLSVSGGSRPEGGFTDGATLRLLGMNQQTTGFGPTGSLELQYHLFRDRVVLFGESRFAFLVQDMTVDTGNFFTIISPQGSTPPIQLPAVARLEQSVSKSTWNFGGQFGVRVRVVPGLQLQVTYDRMSYQDTVLLPYSITIPATEGEISFGSVALYQTQDLELDSIRLTAGFQF